MEARKLLKEYFGYEDFRYPQHEIIESILSGMDTIAILPTGFGKSVTFQIPALMLNGLTIVISPLIALMEDQKNNLFKKGISVAVLHSNLHPSEQQSIFNKIKQNQIKILYVSPERLSNELFRCFISKVLIELIVIDEAHTLLWAEGFREAFGHIDEFIDLLIKRPRIMALTATATHQTVDKIKKYLRMDCPNVIKIGMDRPNICYKVERTTNKIHYLLDYIQSHSYEKGMIYCLTRRRVEQLSLELKSLGIKNAYYHGGLNPSDKCFNQSLFTTGQVKLMICTNAFGMGIDIPDIRYVIHYEIPSSLEDLTQQMGRAARDGKSAEGIVLFSFSDIQTNSYFINKMNEASDTIIKEKRRKLDLVVDYCLSYKCRHQLLAKYFGQKINKCKNNCDNCLKNRKS